MLQGTLRRVDIMLPKSVYEMHVDDGYIHYAYRKTNAYQMHSPDMRCNYQFYVGLAMNDKFVSSIMQAIVFALPLFPTSNAAFYKFYLWTSFWRE